MEFMMKRHRRVRRTVGNNGR